MLMQFIIETAGYRWTRWHYRFRVIMSTRSLVFQSVSLVLLRLITSHVLIFFVLYFLHVFYS